MEKAGKAIEAQTIASQERENNAEKPTENARMTERGNEKQTTESRERETTSRQWVRPIKRSNVLS